jgi:hypothetical protein
LELGGDMGAAISMCVRAVRAGERGPRDSGTDARAHDRPKRQQGDPPNIEREKGKRAQVGADR